MIGMEQVAFRARGGVVRIRFVELVYLEYFDHLVYAHLKDGRVLTSVYMKSSFDEYACPLAGQEMFVRPHQSFVVNMNYIAHLSGHDFILRDGSYIPIARARLRETRERFTAFERKAESKRVVYAVRPETLVSLSSC